MALRRVLFGCALVLLTTATAGAGITAAPRVIARIPLGSAPCAAAPSRGLVWVSNFIDGTVRAIDANRNRAVGRSLSVGPKPCGMSAGGGAEVAVRRRVSFSERAELLCEDERDVGAGRGGTGGSREREHGHEDRHESEPHAPAR